MEKPYTTLRFDVVPNHYALTFEPNFNTFTFRGKTVITVDVKKPTKEIKLHAKELTIFHAVFRGGQAQELHATCKPNPAKEELILTFPEHVKKGKGELSIDFQGKHNDGMYGFYRSKYTEKGKEKYILTTQFEAANARAAFPCFDEPALKAAFDVTLIVPPSLKALSNMPMRQERLLSTGKKEVAFYTTPRMPTYLVYLGVGDFQTEGIQHGKVFVSIVTIPDKIKYAPLALDYTCKFLHFFERYFKIAYPLPKLDMIALPDFASGAMENWGAITFREIALLGDESTSVAVRQHIAITIAHELAHQWFGNLVTMQWWDDIWLNESFATFMSYKAVHALYPEWDVPLQYFEDTIADALSADQLESTHPINVHVKTPGDVDEIFDQISYDKGGSVLHMLEQYVGEKVFQRGLAEYLTAFAYRNATKHDLWTAIQNAHKEKGVNAMMGSWVTQPGYPIIHVARTKERFAITQRRFTLREKRFTQLWPIPICYRTAEGAVKSLVLKGKKAELTDITPWVKLNDGQHGLYRVQYDDTLLGELGKALKAKTFSPLDAAGIENDVFACTAAGIYLLSTYLSFVKQWCDDVSYPLSARISAHLNWLYAFAYRTKARRSVQLLSQTYHGKLVQKLGWNRKAGEKNTDTLMRSASLVSIGIAGEAKALQKALLLYRDVEKGNVSIDQNIKSVVYSLTAWQGNTETYTRLVERYARETVPEESRKLLRALGMFRDQNIVRKALDFSQSAAVRLQDSTIIPATASGNPAFPSELLWQWTKLHWPDLLRRYSGGTHMLSSFVHNLSGIDTLKLKRDVQEFFQNKEHFRDDIKMALKQTLERIDINCALKEKNGL